MAQGVAKLQKESVGWCVGERGHRGNWVLHNWVMLKVLSEVIVLIIQWSRSSSGWCVTDGAMYGIGLSAK